MDSPIQVGTLAVKDCCGKRTSDQIKTLIQQVLTKFEIKRSQLLAVLCDNAANMFKTVRLLNENENDSEDDLEMNSSSEDQDSEEMVDIEENDDDFDYMDHYEEPMEDEIYHMRCVVHTLQLVVKDGLSQGQSSSLKTSLS